MLKSNQYLKSILALTISITSPCCFGFTFPSLKKCLAFLFPSHKHYFLPSLGIMWSFHLDFSFPHPHVSLPCFSPHGSGVSQFSGATRDVKVPPPASRFPFGCCSCGTCCSASEALPPVWPNQPRCLCSEEMSLLPHRLFISPLLSFLPSLSILLSASQLWILQKASLLLDPFSFPSDKTLWAQVKGLAFW